VNKNVIAWLGIGQELTKSLHSNSGSLLARRYFIDGTNQLILAHISIFVSVKKHKRFNNRVECGFQLW
jgi:hypothetical protein